MTGVRDVGGGDGLVERVQHPHESSLGLPRVLVLTDRRACERAGRSLPDTVAAVVAAGSVVDGPTPGVVLREKDLPLRSRAGLAADLRAIVPWLSVASDVALAREVGADGVHLAGSDPWPGSDDGGGRVPLSAGRSCHDAAEVADAARHGASYATLSPVFASPSKPGYGPALGPAALAGHATPVYALGGVEPGRVASCLTAGAVGVAVMGAVMGADDPASVVRRLLDEVAETSERRRR